MSLSAAGTISSNNSDDTTIPIGTPWTFELRYDTAAPDRDFELTGQPDPTFGRFTNASAPPALRFFHYEAGDYSVTLDDPGDFDMFSEVHVTFTVIHALDINIHAVDVFPPLAGGPVSFHADFNAFSTAPVFSNDGLPTNVELGAESFDQSTISLLPATGGVISGSELTSWNLTLLPTTPGDTNGDDLVDLADLNNVRNHFGETGLGDTNADGVVDLADLNNVRNHFGDSAGRPAPEPSMTALAGVSLAVFLIVRVRATIQRSRS
jgi:hypothetical protein